MTLNPPPANQRDTVDTLLPSADDCFVAMITPPSKWLWPLVLLVIALVPLVGWCLLPLLCARSRVLEHMATPRWWTTKAVASLLEMISLLLC